MTDRRFALVILAVLAIAALPSAAQETSCLVKYVSAEHIYLDAGSSKGLAVGMLVRVMRDGVPVAELEVVYAAAHSATARVVVGDTDQTDPTVVVGDQVVFTPPAGFLPPEAVPVQAQPSPTRTVDGGTTEAAGGPGVEVRGSAAIQWDHMTDDSGNGLETNLWSLPFRVKVTHIGNRMTFRARGTLRKIDRAGFSSSLPESEWRNRIQEIALVREGRDLDGHFAVGRVGTRATAAAGPFDGLSFSGRVGGGVRLGAFAGFAPEWEDLGFGTEDRLAGVTMHWHHRSAGGNILDMLIAGVGRYHESEISREYLTMTTTWRTGRRFSLLQGAEVDVNRGWREEAARESMTVTGVALTGRYMVIDGLDVNLGYDDRQPVRTWATMDLPDELFRDAGRLGWRAGLRWRTWRRMTFNLSGSKREDDRYEQDSNSWNARLNLPDFPAARWMTNFSYRGFDGPYLSGWAPSGGVARSWPSGLRLRFDAGHFGYEGTYATETRSSSWAEAGVSQDLGRYWSAAMNYRRDWGDDIEGGRLFLELGVRF
jgi:hypothetical protein